MRIEHRGLAIVGTVAAFGIVAAISFAAGRSSVASETPAQAVWPPDVRLAQARLQEVVPLRPPTGGDQTPGQLPGPPRGADQCQPRFFLFHNGRFYEMRPGPGQGMGPGPGRPGMPQEVIPLQPGPGGGAPGGVPTLPGLPGPGQGPLPGPMPQLPGSPPAQRF
jgi:hypothetical protein